MLHDQEQAEETDKFVARPGGDRYIGCNIWNGLINLQLVQEQRDVFVVVSGTDR